MSERKVQFKLKHVRISFPHLFEPHAFEEGQKKKYSCTLLLDRKEHRKELKQLKAAISEMIKAELKRRTLAEDKVCLRSGELKEELSGYDENIMFLNASNRTRPTVIDRDRSPLTEDDDRIYAGCYVNAIVSLWAMNNKWGKRINANILGVQFDEDGERLSSGSSRADADDFDELEPADTDDEDWDDDEEDDEDDDDDLDGDEEDEDEDDEPPHRKPKRRRRG